VMIYNDSEIGKERILGLRLPELAKRNIALKIYSEVLGCEVWLSSNEQMASPVKGDDPVAVTYTVDELRNLYKLQPSPEELRAIHDTKDIFEGSEIVDSNLKEMGDESDRTQ
jgi:hypothetical protein